MVNIEGGEVVVHGVLVAMVLIGFGADVTILGYGHHAFFEAYAEYLIL